MIGVSSHELSGPALQLYTQATREAAFRGSFDPLQLIGRPDEDAKLEALVALSADCVEVIGEAPGRWELKADARHSVLQSLAEQRKLLETAEVVGGADEFGRQLQLALRGDAPSIEQDDSLGRLELARTAAQFAAPFVRLREVEWEIDAALARRTAEVAFRFAGATRLVGRDNHLRTLRRLAHSALSDFKSSEIIWAVVVTGEPGVGKSALLAEYTRRHAAEHAGFFPVISMDFDRAALSNPTPAILLAELARQIGYAVPAARPAVDDFMSDAGSFDAPSDAPLESVGLEAARETGLWTTWRRTLGRLLSDEPILLILDTLEEVLAHRDGRAEQLAGWLRALVEESGMRRVRLVLAGRTDDGQLAALLGSGARDVPLRELRPASAVRLLGNLFAAKKLNRRSLPLEELVETYGGNPLTLKMISRFVVANGAGSARELLADAGSERFVSEYAQKVLYTRILNRIRSEDPDLEKVAYPGLILRRVTADLIRRVLAEPCGLGSLTESRASSLLEALSQQVWLVDARREPGAVRHRRELRRQMFPAMSLKEPDCAEAIHRAAMHYYGSGADAALSPVEQKAEALYHTAFVEPAALDDPDALAQLGALIGEDVSDLPVEMRARLKLLGDRGLELDELGSLSAIEQAEFVRHNTRDAYRRGATSAAVAVAGLAFARGMSNRSPAATGAGALSPVRPDRSQSLTRVLTRAQDPEVAGERAFAAGNLDDVLGLGPQLVRNFLSDLALGDRGRRSRRATDLTGFAVWRAAMLARGRREGDWMLQEFEEGLRSPGIEWAASLSSNSKEFFTIHDAATALVLLLGGRNLPNSLFHSRQAQSRPELRTTQSLRLAQLRVSLNSHPLVLVELSLLRYLDPAIMENVGRMTDGSRLVTAAAPTVEALQRLHRPDGVATSLREATRRYDRGLGLEARERAFRDPTSATLLRGITPELHQLVQVCLAGAGTDAIAAFAAEAGRRRPTWPADLDAVSIGGRRADLSTRWTATLIEAADRTAMLPDLLNWLCENGRNPEMARRVAHVLGTYDVALMGTKEGRS